MHRRCRLLALAALLGLAPQLGAQVETCEPGTILVVKSQQAQTNPPRWPVPGEDGPSVLVGTDGRDEITDPAGGDTDSLHDAPGGPDGKDDVLDARDGDDLDTLWGGPEDTYLGDPGDRVHVLNSDGHVAWKGTLAEYERTRAVLRWVRDLWQCLLAQAGVDGEPDWQAFVDTASNQLAAVQPEFINGWMTFSDTFALGPYAEGEVPPSPSDALSWLPFEDGQDPAVATSGLTMTPEEHDAAVAGAQALLDHLRTLVAADGD